MHRGGGLKAYRFICIVRPRLEISRGNIIPDSNDTGFISTLYIGMRRLILGFREGWDFPQEAVLNRKVFDLMFILYYTIL